MHLAEMRQGELAPMLLVFHTSYSWEKYEHVLTPTAAGDE
jgi:hypothetical protein